MTEQWTLSGETVWYRLVDKRVTGDEVLFLPFGRSNVRVTIHAFPVLRETPKGVWLRAYGGQKRFVLRDAHKRWAHPTKEEATESFIARKKRQVSLLREQLAQAEAALELLVPLKLAKP